MKKSLLSLVFWGLFFHSNLFADGGHDVGGGIDVIYQGSDGEITEPLDMFIEKHVKEVRGNICDLMGYVYNEKGEQQTAKELDIKWRETLNALHRKAFYKLFKFAVMIKRGLLEQNWGIMNLPKGFKVSYTDDDGNVVQVDSTQQEAIQKVNGAVRKRLDIFLTRSSLDGYKRNANKEEVFKALLTRILHEAYWMHYTNVGDTSSLMKAVNESLRFIGVYDQDGGFQADHFEPKSPAEMSDWLSRNYFVPEVPRPSYECTECKSDSVVDRRRAFLTKLPYTRAESAGFGRGAYAAFMERFEQETGLSREIFSDLKPYYGYYNIEDHRYQSMPAVLKYLQDRENFIVLPVKLNQGEGYPELVTEYNFFIDPANFGPFMAGGEIYQENLDICK